MSDYYNIKVEKFKKVELKKVDLWLSLKRYSINVLFYE